MASTSTTKSFFNFEPSDIRLKVSFKGEPVTAHVSSSAMSFASPVWKKFIFPPWKPMAAQDQTTHSDSTPAAKKSKVAGEREKGDSALPVEEVDFSDDDGETLLILLRIAHLRFHDIPTTLLYQTLLQVAVLCDQYQCVNLVRPWLSQWLVDEEESSMKFGQENWMFIAWVFGREKVYEALARHLVFNLKPTKRSVYRTSYPQTQMQKINDPMPPGTVEHLLEIRKIVLDKILEDILAIVHEYLETKVLGSFLRELQKLNVLPRSKNQDIHNLMSVFEFSHKLFSINIKSVHQKCKSALFNRALVEFSMRAIPDPVLEAPLRHMKRQSRGLKTK